MNELYYHHLKETGKHDYYYTIGKHTHTEESCIDKYMACITGNSIYRSLGHVTMTNMKVKLSKHDNKHPLQLTTGKMRSHHQAGTCYIAV